MEEGFVTADRHQQWVGVTMLHGIYVYSRTLSSENLFLKLEQKDSLFAYA